VSGHLIDGEFQSDKYPTTPRGKVPLSVKDATAQDLLWEYAQRRRAVDAEFAADLETALVTAGYVKRGQNLAPIGANALGQWIVTFAMGEERTYAAGDSIGIGIAIGIRGAVEIRRENEPSWAQMRAALEYASRYVQHESKCPYLRDEHDGFGSCNCGHALVRAAIGAKSESVPLAKPDTMVRVNGVAFRCDCGCNVFKPTGRPNGFACNGCNATYQGES
jgi:hypothetical protein